jgi:putative ABC transport system permease protein
MFINYLRIALRNIRRNKLYSLINISCLAIGIAVVMMIMLYVLHEHSYDRWQANAGRIFKVSSTLEIGNSSVNFEQLGYQAGPMAQQSDGRVESYLRIYQPFEPPVLRLPALPGSEITAEAPVLFADSNFFHFFSFRLIRGNPDKVLIRPYTVVLSARAARKYFGNSDPIGKVLIYNNDYRLEITGIAADPPSNSNINYDLVASLSSIATMKELAENMKSADLQTGNFLTWLLLRDLSAAGKVEQTLVRLSRQNTKDKDRMQDKFHLTALTALHLSGDFENANKRYLQIFPLAAGLILLLALVNYMSLSTARSAIRAKEVGVRKVIGAGRGSIAGQFYTESAVYALLAFVAGTGLFLLFRPVFLNQLQLTIDDSFLLTPLVLCFFGGLLILVILASGSYPSLVLSAFRPVAVLYGKMSRQKGSERVRKGFLVFQFTISMSLILCSVIIGKQLYFLRHTETGVDRENVIMISFSTKLQHYQAFKQDVQALPGIRQAATSQFELYQGYTLSSTAPHGSDKPIMLSVMTVDSDYVSVLDLQWRRRPVTSGMLYARQRVVLNETAVAALNLPGDPLGQKIKVFNQDCEVAGVLNDFNYWTLQSKIGPLCLVLRQPKDSQWGIVSNGCLFARIQPHANLPTLMEKLKKTYARYDSQTPFKYDFLDEVFDKMYKSDDRLAGLFSLFTVISIVIACLGLFALATFAAQQRVKEIGIRKVLGASVGSIGALLSRDFLRPVLLAVLIACPLSWWAMHNWLQDFAYRTAVSWWIFPVAGMGLLLLALVTVLFRTIRAAQANPTINLRGE